jgi:hypothetical protein
MTNLMQRGKLLMLVAIMSIIIIPISLVPVTVFAQQNNQTTATGPVTNFTKLVQQQFSSPSLLEGFAKVPAIDVLYERPKSLVLRAEITNFTALGHVIDIAKQNGYTIDAVTVFTQTSRPTGETRYLTDTYTVFMSKK